MRGSPTAAPAPLDRRMFTPRTEGPGPESDAGSPVLPVGGVRLGGWVLFLSCVCVCVSVSGVLFSVGVCVCVCVCAVELYMY